MGGVARAAGSGRPPGGSRDPPAASPLRLLARIHSCCLAQREELVQSAVESAANIGGQVGAVGRRSYRRGTGLAEGELGSEARRPGDRGHADPGSHGAVHPGPTADGTRGRSASLGRRGISHTTATAPAFVIPRRRVAPHVQRQYNVEVPVAPVAPWSSPLANLASRLVTLVSPLRGDT